MTDADTKSALEAGDGAAPEQYEYVEEVVEYKDTRRERTLLALLLVLLALLLGFFGYRIYNAQKDTIAAVAGTDGMTWIRSIYGWGNGPNQQLITPNTVGIGPDGMIWTNSNNRAAVAFNPDGSFDRILQSRVPTGTTESSKTPGAAAATKQDPLKVAAVFTLDVDGKNNLYIGDNAQGKIMQFSPDGGMKQGWSVPGVNKIAANDTRVLALSQGSAGVFDSRTGQTYFVFGTRGTGELQFDQPFGGHIDDENYVYVADTMNRRVRKFDPTGNLVWEAGKAPDRSKPATSTHAPADSLFQLPTGVTTDGNGRVIVTDAFNYQIFVLDGKTGKKLAAYGDYGSADGLFNNPSAIAYDAERDVFVVADTDNNRLQVIRIKGSSPSAVAGLRRLFDRPVWICLLPFIILLIALFMVWLSRRRRRREEEAAQAAAQATVQPPAVPSPVE